MKVGFFILSSVLLTGCSSIYLNENNRSIANSEEGVDPDYKNFSHFMDPLVGVSSLPGDGNCKRIEITKTFNKMDRFTIETKLKFPVYSVQIGNEKVDASSLNPTYSFQAKIVDDYSYTFQYGGGPSRPADYDYMNNPNGGNSGRRQYSNSPGWGISIEVKKDINGRLQYLSVYNSFDKPIVKFSCGTPEINLTKTRKENIKRNGEIIGEILVVPVNEDYHDGNPIIYRKYFSDVSSKLTWFFERAKFCDRNKDLGKEWRHPTAEEIRLAFNPDNRDESNIALLDMFGRVDENGKERLLWTSTVLPYQTKFTCNQVYDRNTGEFSCEFNDTSSQLGYICVAP